MKKLGQAFGFRAMAGLSLDGQNLSSKRADKLDFSSPFVPRIKGPIRCVMTRFHFLSDKIFSKIAFSSAIILPNQGSRLKFLGTAKKSDVMHQQLKRLRSPLSEDVGFANLPSAFENQ